VDAPPRQRRYCDSLDPYIHDHRWPASLTRYSNAVYPTDAEVVERLGGLEPDLDTDEAARRRGETLGGTSHPTPWG